MEISDLEKKTVTELRELAAPYEDVEGVTGMKKEQLIDVLCERLGIEKKHALPTGIGRRALKQKIRALKKRRDEALAAHDAKALKRARTLLRRTKHHLREIVEHAARASEAETPKSDASAPQAS